VKAALELCLSFISLGNALFPSLFQTVVFLSLLGHSHWAFMQIWIKNHPRSISYFNKKKIDMLTAITLTKLNQTKKSRKHFKKINLSLSFLPIFVSFCCFVLDILPPFLSLL
jgi:hypothetical protein